MSPEFERLLQWAYRGEIAGEAMFLAMAEWPIPDQQRAAMRELAVLEHHMIGLLRLLLERHDISLEPVRAVIARVAAYSSSEA